MSWDEVRVRATQEASKRIDLASYRLGIRNPPNPFSPDRHTVPGNFFFSLEGLVERTALMRKYLDAQVASIVMEADVILEHRFHLLGYESVAYGPQIDWHLDAVHGKRAPLEPWYKINFLDVAEVGDHKVTWELNRHRHFVTLAKAWRFTREQKYVDELIGQWYGWQAANPYPMGINWASSLEVALRSLSWLWVRYLLLDCDCLPANFNADCFRALGRNADYMQRYLSTYFSPNTHLLGEAAALFFIGTLCPQFGRAKRWKECGWNILLQEAQRQVRPDGVYFEQSLFYHVYALDMFLHARLLAARNQIEIPVEFDAILRRMLNFVSALSAAAPPIGFGDDDGGRLFDPRRNRSEHLTDPLAIGALLFENKSWKQAATLTEESIWLCGGAAVKGLPQERRDDQRLSSVAFESGGVYILANSRPEEGQLTVDSGPQGSAKSGHGHADALSVQVSAQGRPWLIDPGTFSYMGEERELFRGTGAHNTLRVDHLDQAIAAGQFGWTSIPNAQAETWIAGKTFTLFAGSHDGYARLPDPVIHRRFVFHLHGSFWLVRDVAEGKSSHELETSWHFAPDISVAQREGSYIASDSHRHFAIVPTKDVVWSSNLTSDYVAPAYGWKQLAPMIRCSAKVNLPASHAVLLRPLTSLSDAGGSLLRTRISEPQVEAYTYEDEKAGKKHTMIFSKIGNATWEYGGLTSDASFVYYCGENEQLTHFILCQGKSAEFKAAVLLARDTRIDHFELRLQGGTTERIR